jgi:hypothetical protein
MKIIAPWLSQGMTAADPLRSTSSSIEGIRDVLGTALLDTGLYQIILTVYRTGA